MARASVRRPNPGNQLIQINISGAFLTFEAGSAGRVERGVSKGVGVRSAAVSLATNSCRVKFDGAVTDAEQILEQLRASGFDGRILAGGTRERSQEDLAQVVLL